MLTYRYTLDVRARTRAEADRVVAERVHVDAPDDFFYGVWLGGEPVVLTSELDEILTRR